MMFRFLFGLLLILFATPALATADARMQVDVLASDEDGSGLHELHANIRHAAELALPALWDRIIPRGARNSMPAEVNALLFMQRAAPTDKGVTVTFHDGRVLNYLKSGGLPYIEQEPVWSLSIQLSNESGNAMPQSASSLQAYAGESATHWGFKLDASGDSLVLQWRWLNRSQVNLTARGTSRLGEFSETRQLADGNPFPQLEAWLIEVLLDARDAYAGPPAASAPVSPPGAITATTAASGQQETTSVEPAEQPRPAAPDSYLLLSIERQASLPEQVLFEDDLRHDPRIINLSLRQVNRDGQQYRLLLTGSDDQWLVEWFRQRGLTLSPTLEGWVAR